MLGVAGKGFTVTDTALDSGETQPWSLTALTVKLPEVLIR
jgi:hypothetical protein